MIHIAAVDDDRIILEEIQKEIELLSDIIGSCTLKCYEKSTELMWDIENNKIADIFLIDIEMPVHNGFELASVIRDKSADAIIIFVTSHIEYAIDGYKYSAFRYIPKVRTKELLSGALSDAVKCIETVQDTFYVIETKEKTMRIRHRDICYFYVRGKYTYFKMIDGCEHKVRKTLAAVYEELNSENFILIDKGCGVNIEHIISIQNYTAKMRGDSVLNISRSKYQKLKDTVRLFWGKNR